MVGSTQKRIGITLAALAGVITLAGCGTRISANATANAPIQYSHVYVTVTQVWVNTSATAGPDDTAWLKQTLATPQTLDLLALTDGTLKEFASQLPIPTGTYNQIRLFLSDTSATLTSSAQSAGAQFNNEVDYFDASNVVQRVPLAVPNAAFGVAFPIKLTVQTAQKAILAALGNAPSTGTGTNTGTNTSTNPVCMPTSSLYNPTQCSNLRASNNNTTTTTNTTSNASTGTVTATAAVVFDATRDLARFVYTNQVGFTLNPQLAGFDLASAGTIRSQLNLSAITADVASGRPDVQVTAEKPNTAGTRNVPVLSAPLRTDGTFILYPFPTDKNSPTTYDLVIHGSGIQTMIIKAVPVQSGSATSATTVNLGSPAVVKAATTYPVNVATANPVSPRGARVGFYQTINASGELPYLIEARTVDPISGVFAVNQTFPNDNLSFGTYSSGGTVTLTTSVPTEGTGAYRLAASAANFGDGDLSGTLTPPASGTTTATTFTGPTLTIPSPATSGTITAAVTISSPGRYDHGVVVITHDGAIVSTTPLESLLVPQQASGTLTIGSIPAGASGATLDGGTYYAEVWVWNSSDPALTFVRQPAAGLIDLRATNAASLTLTIT